MANEFRGGKETNFLTNFYAISKNKFQCLLLQGTFSETLKKTINLKTRVGGNSPLAPSLMTSLQQLQGASSILSEMI